MRKYLPDFLIVGAGKSGTTSLYYYLKEHPEIFMPEIKEPNFFVFRNDNLKRRKLKPMVIINDFDHYANLFKDASDSQKKGEASTYYLTFFEKTIKNIKDVYGEYYNQTKIIIIIRNPIERAFSEYLMLKRWGVEPLDFLPAIHAIKERIEENWPYEFDYILFGKYYEQIKSYLENFSYVKIYLFEDLKNNPLWLIQDIFKFLDVDHSFVPSNLGKKYNVSKKHLRPKTKFHKLFYDLSVTYNPFSPLAKYILPKEVKESIKKKLQATTFIKPQMEPEAREYLRNIFKEDIIKLQDLIKRDLSHWLK